MGWIKHDRTKSIELNFQKHLFSLVKNKVLLVDMKLKPVALCTTAILWFTQNSQRQVSI